MWKPISPPSVTEPTIIEDFESGSLTDWDYNDAGYWSADDGTNTTVIEGNYSLYHPTGEGRTFGDVANHTGPQPGEVYSLRWREDNGPASNHIEIYRGTDAPNPANTTGGYRIRIEHDTDPDSVILDSMAGGSETTIGTVDWSQTTGTQYVLRWHMSEDTNPVHTIEIEDTSTSTIVTSFSATDSSGDASVGDGMGFFAHFNWELTIDRLTVGEEMKTELPSETTIVVEDFEDGVLTDFDQAESPWTASSTSPIEGSYSAYHPSKNSQGYLRDLSNHSTTPQPGDTVEWEWTETLGNQQVVFYLGMDSLSSSSGHYEFEIHFGNDYVSLQHDNGSSETELNRVTWAHTSGDRYLTRISDDGASNPTFNIAIENVSQGTTPVSFSVQDTNGDPRTGSGFGWYAGIGADLKVDNLTVTR